jgi:hypothetical protein
MLKSELLNNIAQKTDPMGEKPEYRIILDTLRKYSHAR